jgi:hypothetical protein
MDNMSLYGPILFFSLIWFTIFWNAHDNDGLLLKCKLYGINKDEFVAIVVYFHLGYHHIYI